MWKTDLLDVCHQGGLKAIHIHPYELGSFEKGRGLTSTALLESLYLSGLKGDKKCLPGQIHSGEEKIIWPCKWRHFDQFFATIIEKIYQLKIILLLVNIKV